MAVTDPIADKIKTFLTEGWMRRARFFENYTQTLFRFSLVLHLAQTRVSGTSLHLTLPSLTFSSVFDSCSGVSQNPFPLHHSFLHVTSMPSNNRNHGY